MRNKLWVGFGGIALSVAMLSAVYPAAVGVPRATSSVLGVVKCDGSTTNCANDGTISAIAAAAGLTVGASTVSSGTTTRVIFDNAGVVGEYVISGTGNVAMTTNGVFTTPNLGTPSALVLTNATGTPSAITLTNGTGLPVAGITGLGTGVGTALGINVGTAGAPVVLNGAGGTPSSLTLTNATGLPVAGITGLGTGVGTALGVNVGSAGAPVLFNGAGGTPSSLTLTNATGTPSAIGLANGTGLPLTTGVTGLLPVANGGTGTATPGIVAGTNVTVTGTWPNQTVNSTGGGGTGCTVPGTANRILLDSGTGCSDLGSFGTTTTLLHGNAGGAPTFGAVVLTTDVSGVLPSANGGMGTIAASTANIVVGGTTAAPTIGTTAASNVQSGASYTIVAGDNTKVVERTNASGAQTDTLPNVSATGFGSGFGYTECSGPVASAQQVTITPNSPSTINGLSAIVIPANTCVSIADPDGTNYVATYGGVLSVANSDATLTVSPIAGSVIASLNLAHANSWSANQTFTNVLNTNASGFELITGAASGTVPTLVPNRAASTTGVGAQASGNLSEIIAGTEVGRWVAGGLTMQTGKEITTAATATGGAGFNLPHGTAPTSPVNGDLWTTTTGLFARINGVTIGPYGTGGGSGCTFTSGTTGGLLTDNGSNGCTTNADAVFATGTLTLGTAGSEVGSVALKNATSGTLTLSPATGALGTVTATLPANTGTIGELNLAQTWTAAQSFNSGDLKLNGATSGTITMNAAATAGANTITWPAGTTDFSATGGANQFVKQSSAGAALTVGTIGTADLPGSGATTVNGQTCTLNSTCTVWHVAGGAQMSGPSGVTTALYDAVLGNSYGGLNPTLDAGTRNLWPLTETLGKLNAEIATAPGTGKSVTFTIFVNGASSGITCTISNAATSCADDVHTASVTEGQAVALQMSFAGTPANPGNSNFSFAGHQ